ncbi:MAG: NUMOD1 domain-containing DNA-binding protein [Bacilli bacterium]
MYSKDKKFTVYMHITPNGKKYIGITCQIPEKRWYDGKGYSRCPHFYAAINKYGWDNIEHIIITEGLTETEALKAEQDWIKYWDTLNPKNGYNLTKGGDTTTLGYKYPIEIRKRMGNPIYQFDIKGNFIKEWISAEYAGSELNVDAGAICKNCKRVSAHCHNYLWRYKDDPIFEDNKISSKAVKEDLLKKIGKNRNYSPVYQFDLNGNFIAEYNNLREAGRQVKGSASNIGRSCKLKHRIGYGYLWRYKNDEDFNTYKPDSEEYKKIILKEYSKNTQCTT